MQVIPRFLMLFLCWGLAACATPSVAQPAASAAAPPAWWAAHVRYMTEGGGVWRTPNPAAATDPAQPDAFGMEWRAVNDGRGLIGRLYGIEAGRETSEFWTFREFFHPGERRVLVHQWGGPGAYGFGETTNLGEDRFQLDQTFWLPDGRSWREGHRTHEQGDAYVTDVFDIGADGQWVARNSNTWTRVRGAQ